MAAVNLSSLVYSAICQFQYGGSIGQSVFSSSPLTSRVERTAELHSDGALYLFEEPTGSLAKHLREKVYIDGSSVVDVGTSHGRECLAVFLCDYDYSEKMDDYGNVKGHLFTAHPPHSTGGGGGFFSPGSPKSPLSPVVTPSERRRRKGYFMVLLHMSGKQTKWGMLKALLRYSSSTHPSIAPASDGRADDGSSVGANVPNRFGELMGECSVSTSSSATVLSNHEVVRLEDVLGTAGGSDTVQTEEPRRVGSPTARSGPAMEVGAASCGAAGDDEELLPEFLSPVTEEESTSSSVGRLPQRLVQSPLFAGCIEGQPANQRCADCGEAFPTWCVLQPFGCFVCINCVGVHRQLWANKCREAEMDRWPPADVDFMSSRGNAAVNAELEYRIATPTDGSVTGSLVTIAPKPEGRQAAAPQRALFIQQKYELRLFTPERHPSQSADGHPSADALVTNGLLPQSAGADADAGPPQYSGLVDVLVKELLAPGEAHVGATCVVTNGYQALWTRGGRKLVNTAGSTAWDERLQIGIENVEKPLYCAVYGAKGELQAAAEFYLPRDVTTGGVACMAVVELLWCQLHKKGSARHEGEVWKIPLLLSYRPLA